MPVDLLKGTVISSALRSDIFHHLNIFNIYILLPVRHNAHQQHVNP